MPLNIIIASKLLKLTVTSILKHLFVFVLLFHFTGKLACFSNNCCFGNINLFGFHLPIQLVEASVFLFFLLYYLKTADKINHNISLLIKYQIIYFSYRFTIEFFRGDSVFNFGYILSDIQIFILILVPILFLLFKFTLKEKITIY